MTLRRPEGFSSDSAPTFTEEGQPVVEQGETAKNNGVRHIGWFERMLSDLSSLSEVKPFFRRTLPLIKKRGRPRETALAQRVIDLKDNQGLSWSQLTRTLQAEPGQHRSKEGYQYLYRTYKPMLENGSISQHVGKSKIKTT